MAFSTAYPDSLIPNGDAYGVNLYFGGGVGTGFWDLPVSVSVFAVDSKPAGAYEPYDQDIERMASDIRSGDHSPVWWVPLVLGTDGLPVRDIAASLAWHVHQRVR